jgi:cell wall-associated NlpC family hydrolase
VIALAISFVVGCKVKTTQDRSMRGSTQTILDTATLYPSINPERMSMIDWFKGVISALLQRNTPARESTSDKYDNNVENEVDQKTFINACLQFLNLPYIWGGDDFKGYDCSGLVQELYAMIGIDPRGDQTAQVLYNYFKGRSTPHKRGVGALVFYGSSPTRVSHVGMMIGDDVMIEAGGGGSRTTSESAAARDNAFVRIRPIDRRSDLIAVLYPMDLPW